MLYVLTMPLFSGKSFTMTLPLDITFGFGIFVSAGLITYVGVGTRAGKKPTANSYQWRVWDTDGNEDCSRQRYLPTDVQPPSLSGSAVSTDREGH